MTISTSRIEIQKRLQALARPNGKWSLTRLGIAAGILVCLLLIACLAVYFSGRTSGVETSRARMIAVTTEPPDATVTSDGKQITDGVAPLGTTIEVSHLGYKTRQVQIQHDNDAKVTLEPAPLHLSVHTSASGAIAKLDGQSIADAPDGSLEYDLPADGVVHRLLLAGAEGKQVFAFSLQVVPGQQPQVTALDANNVLVITSLGKDLTLYGNSALGTAHVGGQGVVILPGGAPITLTDQSHDVIFGEGEDQGSVSIDVSNVPVLMVQSLGGQGRVLITTNADKAVLTVDGLPVARQNRSWTVSKAPGPHNFMLTADGFEPQLWTMTIQRRGIVNKNITLRPKVAAPTMAGLTIAGGTPGAQVALDGNKVGELDASGNFNVPSVVALGKHTVALTKPGFEPRNVEIAVSPGAAGKPLTDAQISKPVLSSSMGTLAFGTSVKGVTLRYRRAGDAQFRDASPSDKLQLQPGQYEIVAEAAGYQRFSTTVNMGKEDVTVPLNLASLPDYDFEDPKQIAHEGAWVKSKTQGKFINLRPGRLNENLVFSRPGKTLFWDKKVEWVIENPAHSARVQYSLEGQSGKLTRRLVVGQDASNQKEAKVEGQSAGQKDSLSLHIRVDAGQVRILNDKGAVLDGFTAPAQDFSNGRIGIRSDGLFLVRSDN